ncbi:hypothetical protein ABZW49_05995 [Nonomuraea wenchangensis]
MTDDLDPAAPPVAAGTIQIWSDLLCPFAYVGLIWLRRARARLGLDGRVRVEHRIFPSNCSMARTPGAAPTPRPSGSDRSRRVSWQGPWAAGFPVVDSFDAGAYDDLLKRAAQ